MITEIISTGTELLLGEIDNENSRWLSAFLNEHGYTVAYRTAVGDNPERMRRVMEIALSRADIIITTGGLGSTQGDITKKAGAEALGLPFVKVEREEDRLRRYYAALGRPWRESFARQAWFAQGAELLPNHAGSASGSFVKKGGKALIHLPGPPFEMKTMAEEAMLPALTKAFGSQGIIRSLIFAVTGLGEADVESRIMEEITHQSNPTIALLARPGYIAVRLTAKAATKEEADALMAPLAKVIRDCLPVMSYHIEADVRRDVTELLKEKGLTVSAAESCTGGLIGKLLTDLPGSSAYFMGSAVTYQNSAKKAVLGVKEESLAAYTAVSGEVAKEMAEGSRRLYGSDIAVSTTGYAGPGKGERGENPGLVYIAVAGPKGTEVHKEQFMGSRKSVRYGAAEKALYYIRNYIAGEDKDKAD